MKNKILYGMDWLKVKAYTTFTRRRNGVDKVLVTVGMCIIALLLLIVMKDSLTTFITEIFADLTAKAKTILGGS